MKKEIIAIAQQDSPTINHTWLHRKSTADTLAVLFPGRGYTCDHPLLYYATDTALQAGLDVLQLTYGFQAGPKRPIEEAYASAIADAQAALEICLQHGYKQLVFISKSMGTAIASSLAGRMPVPVSSFYLTPISRALEGILAHPGPCISGTADPYFRPSLALQLTAAKAIDLHMLEGLDHSLNDPKDVGESLRALQAVMGWLSAFLRRG